MLKNLITAVLVTFTFVASADNTKNLKKHSRVIPKAEVKDTRFFEVGVLKACTTETDEEDAIAEFTGDNETAVK
jgi:hypothetical protein